MKDEFTQFKSPYLLDPVIVVEKTGNLSRGLFLEIANDSLKILSDSKQRLISLGDIKFVKIDAKVSNRQNTVGFALVGAFLGQIMLPRPDGQADRYVEDNGLWAHFLTGALGALAGGLVGYGVDISNSNDPLEFDLERYGEKERMKKVVLSQADESKIHFYYEMAKVFTRSDRNGLNSFSTYDYYRNVSTINMFRSIKLTYSATDRIEAGLAIYSAAEPNFGYYSYMNVTSSNTQYSMTNKVYSYFAMAAYDFFTPDPNRSISLKCGLGIGYAKIDYQLRATETIYINGIYTNTILDRNINKTTFSGLASLECRIYPVDKVSLSLIGDYVYIPENTPSVAIPIDEGNKSFGNFSVGISLGIHF
jgi:hypothetical protein